MVAGFFVGFADGGGEGVLFLHLLPDIIGGDFVFVLEIETGQMVLEAVADVDHGAAEDELGASAGVGEQDPECEKEEQKSCESEEGLGSSDGHWKTSLCLKANVSVGKAGSQILGGAMKRARRGGMSVVLAMMCWVVASAGGGQEAAELPTGVVKFGAFVAQFEAGGRFKLDGTGWPSMGGEWKRVGGEVELRASGGPKGCDGVGRYRFRREGERVSFELVSDECVTRRMILDRSVWVPMAEAKAAPARQITRVAGGRAPARLPACS